MTGANHPAVAGQPLVWLRVEGVSLLIGGVALFATTHQPWWLVPAVILLPDLFMAGYLGGPRVGAAAYNIGHSYPLPIGLSLVGVVGPNPLLLAFGLLWFAHIGLDRALGYGLKYDTDFTHTHLGDLGANRR